MLLPGLLDSYAVMKLIVAYKKEAYSPVHIVKLNFLITCYANISSEVAKSNS